MRINEPKNIVEFSMLLIANFNIFIKFYFYYSSRTKLNIDLWSISQIKVLRILSFIPLATTT